MNMIEALKEEVKNPLKEIQEKNKNQNKSINLIKNAKGKTSRG